MDKNDIKRFERLQEMAKKEFGLTVTRSDEQETFQDVFDDEVDCDGRCLNCDYFDCISGCTAGRG